MARIHMARQARAVRKHVPLGWQPALPAVRNRSTGKLAPGSWCRAGDLHPGMYLLFAAGSGLRHHYEIASVSRRGAKVSVHAVNRPATAVSAPLPGPHWEFECTQRLQVLPKGMVPTVA